MRQYFLNKKNFCSIPTTVPFLKKIYVIFFLFFYIQIYIFIYSASSVMSSWIKIKLPCKTQCLSVTAYYIFRAGCTLIRQLQNRMKLLFSRFTLFQTVLFPPSLFPTMSQGNCYVVTYSYCLGCCSLSLLIFFFVATVARTPPVQLHMEHAQADIHSLYGTWLERRGC